MTTEVEAGRQLLRGWAEELTALRSRLLGFQASLPLSSQETSQEDLDTDPDVLTEMRAVIGNSVLALDSLIKDLHDAAEYSPGQPAARPEGPAAGRLPDLNAESEETRRRLYDLVVKENFTEDLSDPEGVWVPPYTAEQAGLEVLYLGGRWFAVWKKLEKPPHVPARDRWELFVLSENPSQPGTLYYGED